MLSFLMIGLPPCRIVRSYLLHYGYEETLNSFELGNKNSVPPVTISLENGFAEQDSYALIQRKALRQVVILSLANFQGSRLQ